MWWSLLIQMTSHLVLLNIISLNTNLLTSNSHWRSIMEKDLKFTASHEWVRENGDGTVTVGISNHAQGLLGDVVFVDLPDVDDEVTAGENFSLVESVKAASDIYAPISGVIIEINEELEDSPELVNEEPYEGGWIAKIKLSDEGDLEHLIPGDQYLESIEEE